MDDNRDPVSSVFEMQRRSIEQGQRMARQSVEFQRQSARLFLRSLKTQRSVHQKGNDLAQTAAETYLDMLESTVPGDDSAFDGAHALVREQFRLLNDATEQGWNAFEESVAEGVRAYDTFAADYERLADDSLKRYQRALDDRDRLNSE